MDSIDITPAPQTMPHTCAMHGPLIVAVAQVETRMAGYIKNTDAATSEIKAEIDTINVSIRGLEVREATRDATLEVIKKQGDDTLGVVTKLSEKFNSHLIKQAGAVAGGVTGGGSLLYILYLLIKSKYGG